jgi:hypothetical protein
MCIEVAAGVHREAKHHDCPTRRRLSSNLVCKGIEPVNIKCESRVNVWTGVSR